MASLSSGDTSIDWLWGSLKPWQILHSTLAERQRCGNVLDVWELVNESLSASTLTRRQDGDGGRSHTPMHFLGDIIDGDFWRHGGVMESRVKECLNALKNAEEKEEEEELEVAHHYHLHHSIHRCNTELSTIASSTQHSCTPRLTIARESTTAADPDDQNYCKVELEEQEEADDQDEMLNEVAALQAVAAVEEEEEEEEEDMEEDEEEEEELDEPDSRSAPYTAPHIMRADNYSLIRLNYQAKSDYRDVSRDSASVLVLSPCCSAAAGAAGDDQVAAAWGETANLEEGMGRAPPDLEENIEVCAVCLEKLTHYYEEGVQALACRHAFHTDCIAPWMQRQPHACCPCCRAPIFPGNLGPPLHLAGAALDLAADDYRLHDRYACAGVREEQRVERASNDIMGLLADMEAALEHLGFRS